MMKSQKASPTSLKRLPKPRMLTKYEQLLSSHPPKRAPSHLPSHLPPLHPLTELKSTRQLAQWAVDNQEETTRTTGSQEEKEYSIGLELQSTATFLQLDKQEHSSNQTYEPPSTLEFTFGSGEGNSLTEARTQASRSQILGQFRLGKYDEMYKPVSFRSRPQLPQGGEQASKRRRTLSYRGVHAGDPSGLAPPLPPIRGNCS